jgi:phytoene dehydrogenase-like protein
MKEIIIVGAGLGGLTAGNLLAKKGHKVTIFESHSMPGGYTAGFYRKGFYFESGTLGLEASASMFKAMKDIGVFEQIEFVRHEIRYIAKNLDSIPENFDDYKRMIYSACPDEEKTLDKFFAETDKIKKLMNNAEEPAPLLFNGWKMLIKAFPYIITGAKLMVSAREYLDMTSSEFLENYFKKDTIPYKLFTIGYPDMSVFLLCPEWILKDYWTVKGGMQSWADVLAENFRSLGGELKLKSYVDGIITKRGVAAGVSCKNKIYNADYVISAGDYKKTFLKLLDDQSLISGELKDKINRSPVSEGFFTVYLGLNMSNEGLAKHMKVPHIYIIDDEFDRDIYRSTLVSFYSPSLVNPKHAPEGKSSLMLQAMVPYHWMDSWGGGDPERYKQLKEKVMKAMIDYASKFIPNLKGSIEYKDAATPLTYERFTHNTDGASSSWSWNPKKKFYNNPMSVNVKTPVKNLYMGSCWAVQNGGTIGALLAAYKCVQKIK